MKRWVRDPAGDLRKMTLTAIDAGWALEIAGVANPLFFKVGAQAEAAARRLGARLVRAGGSAVVDVYLRGGAFAARFNCIEGATVDPGSPRRIHRSS
ncbi:MAG: hypothetical protein JO303_16065 [Caulobacteraceae bacterium]|nr:hypothetical protein [Caulobacteraceae bacterium]